MKDAASQVVKFEMRNDSLVKVGETNAFIGLGAADGYFYGYGDTVSIYNKVKDAVSVRMMQARRLSITSTTTTAMMRLQKFRESSVRGR